MQPVSPVGPVGPVGPVVPVVPVCPVGPSCVNIICCTFKRTDGVVVDTALHCAFTPVDCTMTSIYSLGFIDTVYAVVTTTFILDCFRDAMK